MQPHQFDPEMSREAGDVPLNAPAPDGSTALADFLTALHKGVVPAPSGLSFPTAMLAEFDRLFAFTESNARECGFALQFDPVTQAFGHGGTVVGNANSIDPRIMPGIDDPHCFGFVHAHPSASFGYKGGFCPHSVEDLLTFEYYRDRPFWFMVVVSGPALYTMISIRGRSVWSDAVKQYLNGRLQKSQQKGENLIHLAAGGQQAYGERYVTIDPTPEAAQALRLELINGYPGFGKAMEQISYDECTMFSTEYGYIFAVRRPSSAPRVCQIL